MGTGSSKTAMVYHRRFMSWLRRFRIHLALFVVALVVFCSTAGTRLLEQSSDPHFVYQADAWLHGQLAITPPPAKGDDWAKVETVVLDDGAVVRGRRKATTPTFRTLAGEELPLTRLQRSLGQVHYVSFPPFPALLLVPQVLITGRRANDVAFTVLIAALCAPLAFSVLQRLRRQGLSARSTGENLWLCAALLAGSVMFFSAVQGRVWFTAHIVGVLLALGYTWAAIGASRPLLAGLCLGCAAITRAPMAFMFPLFLFEAWRMSAGQWNPLAKRLAAFAAPVVVIAVAAMAHNAARFGNPLEFGHAYLDVRQQAQMETIGMFSWAYLSRNLAVALTLLPSVHSTAPYITISGHGLAIWLTTPVLLYVLWPRRTGPLHRALWVTVAAVALPSLLYQNSGWFQFGYRFSLDYLVFLIVLLAIGGRPLTKLAKAIIVIGIVINTFGALTFARQPQFYGGQYGVVIAH